MNRCLGVSILFLLIVGKLDNVNGYAAYKWVPLKEGDALPENIVYVEGLEDKYIGRARHFDEILPAEISANGSAIISSCHKEIPKYLFEILTVSVECYWTSYSAFEDIDDTVVRAGTAWNGEPIYVGASYIHGYPRHISSIYLTTRERYTWFSYENYYYSNSDHRYLSCSTKTKWIDSSSKNLPNNTISGGNSEEDYEMYVAQLKRGCEVVTGQVIPEIGIATAILNSGTAIEASYCQVLVGEPNEYTWIPASDGEIPDYAVVNGKYNSELAYVVRVNKTIRSLTHSYALSQQLDYDVLVANQL